MDSLYAMAIAASLFSFRPASAQTMASPPVHIVPPTLGSRAEALLPSGPYRLTLTVPHTAGAPPITRHVRGALTHAGNTVTLRLEHSLLLHGTVTGDRLALSAADARGDTLALALTTNGSHAVGTVVIANNAQRAIGTTILEPDASQGPHGGGQSSARNRDGDGPCLNVVLCLIRDLFGIVIDLDP